jgi:hypothetical protein
MSSAVHDVVMERAASVAAYGTSGAVAVTGFSMNELFGLIGVALAAATFAVNWYYKERADRRAEREQARKEWASLNKSVGNDCSGK